MNPPRGAAEGGSTVGRRPIGEDSRRNEHVPTQVTLLRSVRKHVEVFPPVENPVDKGVEKARFALLHLVRTGI